MVAILQYLWNYFDIHNMSEARLAPIDLPTKPTTKPAKPLPDATDEMTVGLPAHMQSWAPVFHWARRHAIQDAVSLIVDASFLARFTPSNLIHFLSFVCHSRSRRLLEAWRLEDPVAELLFRLGNAFDDDDEEIRALPQPSRSQAKDQIRGNSETLYLLGLVIAEPPSNFSGRALEEFHTLKLWTLIQLLKQAADGLYREAFMVELATRIRQSEEVTHEFAGALIRQILPRTEDFSSIRYLLGQSATKVLERLKKEAKKGNTAQKFLWTVIKISESKTGKKGPGPNQSGQADLWQLFGGDLSDFEPLRRPPVIPDLPDDDNLPITLPIDEEEDLAVFDLGNLRTSLAENRQEEVDLLATNVEYQQALPYSWHNLNPLEQDALNQWIEDTLNAPELPHSHQLLAVFSWIGLKAGRSLRNVQSMPIKREADTEWAWNIEESCLHRLPPKRRNAWEPKAEHQPWIVPTAAHETLLLPERIQGILFEARQGRTDAATLGDLWGQAAERPDRLFRKLLDRKTLGRVRPGMLANRLYLKTYQDTGNVALSRLVSAHPFKGLPGACAYPSFLGSDLPTPFISSCNDEIALGSRLDPLDQRLRQSIGRASRRLAQCCLEGDLIRYHNELTAYLRQAILACTGARPVQDLLDSPRRIDGEQHFLFVDDKGSTAAPQGRLAPLTRQLSHYLLRDYARYLRLLARTLQAAAPTMADEIHRLSQGEPSIRIPYLFLLRVRNGTLRWELPSSQAIEALDLFDWPLPDNLFRHRLGDRLRRSGIDAEIIDAVLGHLTHNTATYGPYSRRSWNEDQSQLRPAIESAFSALGFRLPKIGRKLPELPEPILFEQPLTPSRFGAEARRQARRKMKQSAFLAANTRIEQVVEGRDLTELDEEELQSLAQELCFYPTGEPRPDGLQRYAHLLRKLEAAWLKKGKRLKVGRKTFRGGYREASPFLPEAAQAQALYAQFIDSPSCLFIAFVLSCSSGTGTRWGRLCMRQAPDAY